jgi:COX assembly protein 1
MNACMLQYQTQDELDTARRQWFTLAGERKRQREEHKRQLEDARSKHKEWWNLDEEGKVQGKRAEEERVYGGRKEEDRRDERGVVRGGIYRGT